MQINVGDKINYYILELNIDGNVKKKNEGYPVVAVKKCEEYSNKKEGQYIVIETCSYKIIQTIYEKYSSHTTLEKASVYEQKWHTDVLKDYIQASIYTAETDDKKVYKKLKKEIEKYLNKNYGRYGNYIDLLDKIEI